MEKVVILKAIDVLNSKVDNSNLNDSEKNAMKLLLNKIEAYYQKQYESFFAHSDRESVIRKKAILDSTITDYLVSINDAINGKYDIFGMVNIIYKEINYDPKKGRFKVKRLNN